MTDNSNTPTAANAQRTMYGILLLIGTTHLLNDMIQSLIPAIYPILKDSYDFSFSQIGIITLVFQLTSSLLQPFVGIYADRNPRPYMLAAGVIFTLIGLLCLSVSSTYAYILISVGLIGCGSSIFHPGASQVAQMASGGKKGLAQSIFQVGGNGGNAIGPLLAALIILPFGQSAIGWFTIATLLSFIILCYIGNWYRRQLRHSLHNVKVKAASATGLSKKQIKYALLILVILIFSKYFYFSCMTSYFTFFLIDKFSMSVQNSQLCLFAFLAASTIGTLAGGSIGDRYGRKLVILSREAGYRVEQRDAERRPFLPESFFEGNLDEFWRRLPSVDAEFETQRLRLAEAGRRWRFVARMEDGRMSVGLEEVGDDSPFYHLSGSNNVILITTERYREYPMQIKGYGAGAAVTAAGVFADIIRIANIR